MCSPRENCEHNSKSLLDCLQTTNPTVEIHLLHEWCTYMKFFWKFRIHLVQNQTVKKINYKLFYVFIFYNFLTDWICTKWIRNFQNFARTCTTHEVDEFQQFRFVVWNQSDKLLKLCSPTPLSEHITPVVKNAHLDRLIGRLVVGGD